MADSNRGDAPIFRRVTAMAASDRARIALWSAALREPAQMVRWQSAELRQQAAAARAKALALRVARSSALKDPDAD